MFSIFSRNIPRPPRPSIALLFVLPVGRAPFSQDRSLHRGLFAWGIRRALRVKYAASFLVLSVIRDKVDRHGRKVGFPALDMYLRDL